MTSLSEKGELFTRQFTQFELQMLHAACDYHKDKLELEATWLHDRPMSPERQIIVDKMRQEAILYLRLAYKVLYGEEL